MLSLLAFAPAFAATPTITTLKASPSPSNYGQVVTLTATVTAGASGKVTFYAGVTIVGVVSLVGDQATLSAVMLPSGTNMLRAYYNGDGWALAASISSGRRPICTTAGDGAVESACRRHNMLRGPRKRGLSTSRVIVNWP